MQNNKKVKGLKYKIPESIYEVKATIEGNVFTTTVKAGETVTPLYNAETKTVTWEKEHHES